MRTASDLVPDLATSVRRATSADAAELAALINRAYAIEQAFVDGDRTDVAEVTELIARGTFVVLERQGGLAAAVHVDGTGYFGMLSVDPGWQQHGLGTRLVRIAEAMCEAAGCATVRLRIISLREELGRWYRSLGYREVGTTRYDEGERVVKQPFHFVDMAKVLPSVVAVAA